MIPRVHWNLRSFLKKVEFHLVGMKRREKKEILAEIRTHIKESAAELNSGKISTESIDSAIGEMGDPKEIAARYREDEEIRVELGTRLLLLANVAWGLWLIVVSIFYYASGWNSRHTPLLTSGVLGIILGAMIVSLYLVQCLRPGIIPSMRVYVLAPAFSGAALLLIMMVAAVNYFLPQSYPRFGWELDLAWAMATAIPTLGVVSVVWCFHDCRRYPFLFRGVGFVIDGYVRSMNKALKPLDSVTKHSLVGEIEAHVEERSRSIEGLSRKERKKKLEEEMGDPAEASRRLIDLHETRMKTSVRLLLYTFIVLGLGSLTFALYVGQSIISMWRAAWGWFYVTQEGWMFIAVLLVLAISLIVFAAKQLTYHPKTKDYLVPSVALAVVVILILSLGVSSLASGDLRPTEDVNDQNQFLIDGVFERETGGYDVFWADDLDGGFQTTEGSFHHSVLNEDGSVIEHRKLGRFETTYPLWFDRSVKIGDSFFFVGDSWVRVLGPNESSFRLAAIPDYHRMEAFEDNVNLGLVWMSERDGRCNFHYGQVTQAADFDEVWVHDLGTCAWGYPTIAPQGDMVFLLWDDGSWSENHSETILRYGFFSLDGSIENQGMLYQSNITQSGPSGIPNATSSHPGGAFWLGSRVWVMWSYWNLLDGMYEYQFKLTSIDGYGSSRVNFTLQIYQEDLSEYGSEYNIDFRPSVVPFLPLNNLGESGVVPYFFSVMHKSDVTREYETDLSISDIYIFRVGESGNLIYHTRTHRPFTGNPFLLPVSLTRDNETFVVWIDWDEVSGRYDSTLLHCMKLSSNGDLLESKALVTDVRMNYVMYSSMQLENAVSMSPDGSFDFIGLAARPRDGLTEAVLGKSTRTPWGQQVVHARVDPNSERATFHPISRESTIPDSMLDLIAALTVPVIAVILLQWSYIQLRIRWSRSRGAF